VKKLTLKLVGVVAIVCLLVFVAGPPITKAVGQIISFLNPVTTLVDRLKDDIRVLRARNTDYQVERDSLNSALQQASTLSTVKGAALDEALARVDKLLGKQAKLMSAVDSLGGEIVSIREGRGSVVIMESGQLVNNKYSDDWVDIEVFGRVPSDSSITDTVAYDSVGYSFQFGVGNVEVSLQDSSENVRTIYSVWIQSLKDTTNRRFLDNFVLNETVLKDKLRVWDWNNLRLIGIVEPIGGVHMGLGASLFSWNPGLHGGAGGNLLRLPLFGVVTDGKSSHGLLIGAIANIGYFIPIIENMYLGGGYGFLMNRFVITVGVAL